MKCVVTGGAGFIGSHLVDALVERGHEVIVLDDLSTGRISNLNSRAYLYEVDVCTSKAARILSGCRPNLVFHLAAQPSVGQSNNNPLRDLTVNVHGTLNMMIASSTAGVERFVFSSSAAVYGTPQSLPISEDHPAKPLSPYGMSKLTAERYLHMMTAQHNINCAILRYSNVYGPRQTVKGEAGVVAIFTDRAVHGQEIEVHGDGEQTRDFIEVSDVVAANLAAAASGVIGPLNISTGQSITINDLHRTIALVTGRKLDLRYLPARPGEIRHSTLDNGAARAALRWEPRTTLSEGIVVLMRDLVGATELKRMAAARYNGACDPTGAVRIRPSS